MATTDPATWADLFTYSVDTREAQFVKPEDTDRAEWCVYDDVRYLGMVRTNQECNEVQWRIGATAEYHHDLADAVRALRRTA
ncbi:hypothetical protein ACTWQF_30315 [Streptomyces sp. 8N114]|uniref:hypothetical protein n=1 Tax=Streptomyces sp. 8N114 TaxID=3457419 RepID=UPI003FD68261